MTETMKDTKTNKIFWHKDFFLPIMINLVTAALLVLGAFLFKGPIMKFFGDTDEPYPILCLYEPVPNESNPILMDVEIFIINQTNKKIAFEDLEKLVHDQVVKRGRYIASSDLIFKIHDNQKNVEITDVNSVLGFNDYKGNIKPIPPTKEDEPWRIRIYEIDPYKIFMFRAQTTCRILTAKRASPGAVPFDIEYPGRKQQ